MSIPRILLTSCWLLLLAGEGVAQLSQKPFLQKSNALIGASYTRMLGDEVYDQDLIRMQFGYMYDFQNTEKMRVRLGAMYRVKGGKSFFENTYQTFSYINIPVSLSIPFSGFSHFGLSAQPGFLLFNETRFRGTKSLLSPSPHPRSPSSMDLSLSPFLEFKLTETVGLNFAGSYSFGSTTSEDTRLNFGGLSVSLMLNFGQAVKGVENLVSKGKSKGSELVDLQNGTVIVVLNKKTAVAKYFRQQGDTAKATAILRDAKVKNKALIAAFEKHYKFSNFLFVYNNQVTPICSGDSTQMLFNANGKEIPVSDISRQKYVFFYPGDIYLKLQEFSGNGYFFEDAQGKRLSDPFPTQVGLRKRPTDFNVLVKGLNKRLENRVELIVN